MAALARWCFRHRRTVLIAWLVAFIGLGFAARTIGDDYKDAFSLPGTDSQAAYDLLAEEFPAASGESASIVLHARSGTLTDPELRTDATEMLATVAGLPHVAEVASPYGADGGSQVSDDGRTAFATITIEGQIADLTADDIKRIVDTARAADGGNLQVEATGNVISFAEQPEQSYSELIGVIAAAIILFVAFGSLIAMTLPLITALVALGIATSIIPLLSHVTTISDISTMLTMLVGLGVGIDYALFIVNRHRIALRAGKSVEEAAISAVNTSGRAVLFAGITVCIALLGMFALGVSFLYGIAVAAALGVAFTMAASVTLLPALLGFYGQKVLSRRERRRIAEHGPEPEHPSGFWWRWAKLIERRPKTLAVVAAALIVVVALPFLSLRLGSSDQGNGAETKTSKRGYDLLADGFGPGFNGPFLIAARTDAPGDAATVERLAERLADTPGVESVLPPRTSPTGGAMTITLFPTTSPQDAETSKLLERLRDDVVPSVVGESGTEVYIGGSTATGEDFSSVLQAKLPLFIGVVVILAFLLLVAVFRSLLIPLTASLMNLLALGAAFGVIVSVFQWGWLGGVFGISGGPVEAFFPVILFAVLFGLSMDYEVFLVSRMHEEWSARRDNRLAVTLGQAETGRVVAAAGAIMTLVFASFILGDDRIMKMFGLGLAMAILIDAFLIRAVLVPALMHLFGKANWWLPGPLDRVLPRLSVEPTVEELGEIVPQAASAGSNGSTIPGQAVPRHRLDKSAGRH
ncbi:MMPL family transporter [Frankia sp. CNm7]|uniref:MMPL family transporter n=1 Tax=Frankia nepalensis TaxID=1836974 RepID=A0A937RUD5_9ACTN|nr:MMPL family transporter [Frankia nepalensis]MBL7497251.1 MMPL family transporter [Frankia nepalensis]MBL7512953.1 MMPL family transporter [Frankia nepalensis]MBL7519196.1 MMPL family transporter [Frankia nepalensis]MBL7633489.1 MMPL family transporter [Frankia nepalensis]